MSLNVLLVVRPADPADAPVETLQPPYSLIARAAENEILPFAEREGIGVIVYSPMGSGVLTGAMTHERIASLPEDDWRKRDSRFQEPRLRGTSPSSSGWGRWPSATGRAPAPLQVAWTLTNPAVDGAIVGFRRPNQVTRSWTPPTSSSPTTILRR